MRPLLCSCLALGVTSAPMTVLAQQAPQHRNLCTHATSIAGAGCPKPSQDVKARMDAFDHFQEQQELRANIKAALEKGDCAGARKTAVDQGAHELAGRIRRACKALS